MGGRAKRILPFYSKEAEELHVDLPNQRHPELCHSEQAGGSRSQSKAGAGQNTVRDRSSELFNVLFSVGNNQLTKASLEHLLAKPEVQMLRENSDRKDKNRTCSLGSRACGRGHIPITAGWLAAASCSP